jgi:hypothetical protein
MVMLRLSSSTLDQCGLHHSKCLPSHSIMAMLDQDKVKMLEQEFKAEQRGLRLDSFVWLFLTVLTYSEEEKVDVVNGSIKLFHDIDINGDSRLEWKEFNQYVIDQVSTTQVTSTLFEEGISNI